MNSVSIAPMCLSGIESGLASGPFAQCANVTGIQSIVKTNGSIVEPLNSYLIDFCPRQACSSETLQNASSIVSKDCQSSGGSADGINFGAFLPDVIENFNYIKAAACVEHKSNMSYCVPELLTDLEKSTGIQLNISTIESLASGGVTGLLTKFASVPKSVYCTPCGSGIVTEVFAVAERFNVSSSELSTIKSVVTNACPDYQNFGGSSLPSGIATASNSTSSKRSHARALFLD